jgi:hypothetical protein
MHVSFTRKLVIFTRLRVDLIRNLLLCTEKFYVWTWMFFYKVLQLFTVFYKLSTTLLKNYI